MDTAYATIRQYMGEKSKKTRQFLLLIVGVVCLLAVVSAAVWLAVTADKRAFEQEATKTTEDIAKDHKKGTEKTYYVDEKKDDDSEATQGAVTVDESGDVRYAYVTNGRYAASMAPKKQPSDDTKFVVSEPPRQSIGTPFTIVPPTGQLNSGSTYQVLLLKNPEYSGELNDVRYVMSRSDDKLGIDAEVWATASKLSTSTQLLTISPTPGNMYMHLRATAGGTSAEFVSSPIHVAIDESARTAELASYINREITTKNRPQTTDTRIDTDFIQPWMYSHASEATIVKDLKVLKRAGYSNIIMQSLASTTGGKPGDPLHIKSVWYETNALAQYKNADTVTYDMLGKLFSAANRVGIGVYLGGSDNEQWWNESDVKNQAWADANATFENALYEDLHNKYANNPAFKGWYWTPELYSNPSNLEQHWSKYLNNVLAGFAQYGDTSPLVISPFLSSHLYVDEATWRSNWNTFIDSTNFRPGDSVALQDNLMVAELSVDEIIARWNIVKDGVDRKPGLQFQINVENFFDGRQGKTENFTKQLEIASRFASALTSFSYTHYYSPIRTVSSQSQPDASYDDKYRDFNGIDTSNDVPITALSAPQRGSVYVDAEGREAPLPAGFSVSSEQDERTIRTGLVVRDAAGNEFVWVPVSDWQTRAKKYQYTNDEYAKVYYSRYLGSSSSIDDSTTGPMPAGVASEQAQILRYSGFYVGRYESSYDYNQNDPRVRVRQVTDQNADPAFSWDYADSAIYTGRLWNNISSIDATQKASQMAAQYGYDASLKTGLVTGTQWDTYLKWVHSNDASFTMVNDGRSWGNYSDSIGNAATGNYASGELRGTGTNQYWQANNVFDVAGNLAEWTNETTGSGETNIRSNGYTGNGIYGNAAYALPSGPYRFPHVGFRVVLYVE